MMKPTVELVDLTGASDLPGCCKPVRNILHWLGKLPLALGVPGLGHSSGSAVVPAPKKFPDCWFSAGDGARKPLPHVPRSTNSSMGLYLTDIFGVVAPPTPWL